MISFEIGTGKFNLRSAAIIIRDSHILIHKAIVDDFWTLPGGRVEFQEASEDTVKREMMEELGWNCHVNRLVLHIDNFYVYEKTPMHETANYYEVTVLDDINITPEVDFLGIEHDVSLVFKWVALAKIDSYTLKPTCLVNQLKDLPQTTQYIKHSDMINE